MDADAIDLHILFRVDEDVFNTANDPGLNEITPIRRYFNGHIRGCDLKLAVIDDILGMQLGFETEGLIVFHAELGNMRLRYTAGGQHFLHFLLGNQQRLRNLALLVQLDSLADLVMDRLHHIQAALFSQGGGEQSLEGLLLLGGGLGNGGIEEGLHQAS